MRVEKIGLATLYLGDCREIAPTLKKSNAVITDPPYGIGYEYDSYDDTSENLDNLIIDLFPIARFADRAIIFANHQKIWRFPPADWIGAVSWNTTGSYGKLGICQWTPFLFYGVDLPGFGSVNGLIKSDVYRINGGDGVGFRREEKIDHPCPKPLNIMRWLVGRFSNQNDTILDLFAGSGSTGVAAVSMGRKFTGIEIEPKYFDIACRRIEEAQRQGDLFRDAAAAE